MAWDLETAYVRTGLDQSATNDTLLAAAMTASLSVAEVWLNRKLTFSVDLESFPMAYYPDSLTLRRYPLSEIISVTHATEQMVLPLEPTDRPYPGRYVVHADTGLIYFQTPVASQQVVVEYEGGYVEFPADMELALWLIFDEVFGSMAPDDTDDSSTGDLGAVTSITVPDVGTVRFATVSTSSVTGAASGSDANPFIPAGAAAILSPYRRKYA
jgi:hypothetical protein